MKKTNKNKAVWYDAIAALLAFIFFSSVTENIYDFARTGVQNSPNSYALVGALVLVVYSYYKNNKLSLAANQTMMCLTTSGAIWGFGLHGWLR